jgi:hypothetical protein
MRSGSLWLALGSPYEQAEAVYALVLKFTNEAIPGQTVGRATDVIATIKFKSDDRGTMLQRIDHGVWLNSSFSATDLVVGDTRELVLLVDAPNRSLLVDAPDQSLRALEDKRIEINYPEQFQYLRVAKTTGLLDFIEVTLTDRRSQSTFRRVFRVCMQGANFNVSEIA